jgi:hypothetical protein
VKWLAVLALFYCLDSWGATYCVRPDGTAVDKAAGTSCAAASTSMSMATLMGETLSAGDIVYISGTHTASQSCLSTTATMCVPFSGSAGNPITFNFTPPDGDAGKLVACSGCVYTLYAGAARQYIKFVDAEITGAATDPSTYVLAAIASDGDTTLDWTFTGNTRIYGVTTPSVSYGCMRIRGVTFSLGDTSRAKYDGYAIYNCPTDGLMIDGNSHTIINGYIYNVDRDGNNGGDPIQYQGGVGAAFNHTDILIKDNKLVAGSSAKHALTMQCDSSDANASSNIQLTGNLLFQGQDTIDLSNCEDVRMSRNEHRMVSGMGTNGGTVIRCGGVADCPASGSIIGDVFRNPDNATEATTYIKWQEGPTGNWIVANNTFGSLGSGASDRSIWWLDSAATENGTLQIFNNLITNSTVGMRIEPTTTTYSAANNWFYGVTTRYSSGGQDETGTNDVNGTDPLFVGGDNPSVVAGLKLSAASTARRAGKDLNAGNYQDAGNRAFAHPPSIGAWEATSGDAASARTAR